MGNTYTINFKQIQQEGFSELFASLNRAFESIGIDFYIVGAVARDAWFAQKGLKASGTRDVDLVIYIPKKEKFPALKNYLEEKEGFKSSTQNPYVMFSPKEHQVDLLPFGEIEVEGKVMIPGTGLTQIAVNGFREVYEAALIPVNFEGEQIFKVCTLPGIVILKLIAYDDRPEHRQKDIGDISRILQNYFEIESDLIYEHHIDLFESDSEQLLIAARVLGRQMRNILARSEDLKKRVESIIQTAIDNKDNHQVLALFRFDKETTIEFVVNLLTEIIKGINDK